MKRFSRYTFILILLLLNLGALAGYYLIFHNIKSKNNTISALENDIEFQLGKEKELLSITKLVHDTEADRKKIREYFVPKEGLVSLIETVEGFGGISGTVLTVDAVSLQEIEKMPNKESVRFDMSIEGTWTGIMYVVSLIENLPYGVTIERVGLNRTTEEGKPVSWRATLSAVILKDK
jgi:hypothetical protein